MIFNHIAQSALKSVIFLAGNQQTGIKYSIHEIADKIEENAHSVGKLLQILVKKKIINSTKGPHGGFFITEKQFHAPLIKVLEAIEGKYKFDGCLLGFMNCSEEHPCGIHNEFMASQEALRKMLHFSKISDLKIFEKGKQIEIIERIEIVKVVA